MVLYWWTCCRCGDRMELTPDEQRTRHDQRAHLTSHPDWSPTDLELRVSHWGFRIQEEEG